MQLDNDEKLVFTYLACLSSIPQRIPQFFGELSEIEIKTQNKLLLANLQMLRLKVMLEDKDCDKELMLDECQTLLKAFKEICCAEGEALIYYVHACLEREINRELGRQEQNIDLTLMLLQRRVSFV